MTGASSAASTGRFQAGLLALGFMHARFGHTSQALQVKFSFDSKLNLMYSQCKLCFLHKIPFI